MKILAILTLDPASTQPPSQEQMERMGRFVAEVKSKGALVDTGGAGPGALEMKIARKNGKFTMTDGPFAEAKEVVGGYAVLEVADREEAIAITRQFLEIAGDGTCEVHEVFSD